MHLCQLADLPPVHSCVGCLTVVFVFPCLRCCSGGTSSSCYLCNFQGDCTKAKKELGWVPEITFKELVKDMMKSDIANVDAGNDHS